MDKEKNTMTAQGGINLIQLNEILQDNGLAISV